MFNPIEWLAWVYGKFFISHQGLGWILMCAAGAGVMALIWGRAVDKYEGENPHTIKNIIEFLNPYQATSDETPDGGSNVGLWWIPVRLIDSKQSIKNVTVTVRWHEAVKYSHREFHKVWWVMPGKLEPEIELIPGTVRMINLVARRAVDDKRGWYGILLEENLMSQKEKLPDQRNERIRFPAGTDQRLTVTVLLGNRQLGSKDYVVHIPAKHENNAKFWLQDPDTLPAVSFSN